jgi:hypothetical protein
MTSRHAEEKLHCDLERFTFGWAALPVCTDLLPKDLSAAMNATHLGGTMAVYRITDVKAAARRRAEEEKRTKEEEDKKAAEASQKISSSAVEAIPDHHLVVARLTGDEMKNPKLKDLLGPLDRPLLIMPSIFLVSPTRACMAWSTCAVGFAPWFCKDGCKPLLFALRRDGPSMHPLAPSVKRLLPCAATRLSRPRYSPVPAVPRAT